MIEEETIKRWNRRRKRRKNVIIERINMQNSLIFVFVIFMKILSKTESFSFQSPLPVRISSPSPKRRRIIKTTFSNTQNSIFNYSHNKMKKDGACSEEGKENTIITNKKTGPTHVGIILDGNGRWAKQKKLPISIGHAKGAEQATKIIRHLIDIRRHRRDDDIGLNIKFCTLYVFSSENWSRPNREILDIWNVIANLLNTWKLFHKNSNVRFRILGDLEDERLPKSLVKQLHALEQNENIANRNENKSNTLTVSLALNYGGRQDIVSAAQQILDSHLASTNNTSNPSSSPPPTKLTPEIFASYLCTGKKLRMSDDSKLPFSSPPPLDLIIRTGGEFRLSNFLLWDAAYAELYFTDTYFPDFDVDLFYKALYWFQARERRFGSRRNNDVDDDSSSRSKFDNAGIVAENMKESIIIQNKSQKGETIMTTTSASTETSNNVTTTSTC